MKILNKFLFISFLLFSSINSFSQWFDVGIKGGYGVNFIIDNNAFVNNGFTPNFSFGNCFGVKAGFNFSDYHEFAFEYNILNQSQSYNIKTDINSYEKTINYSSFSIPLLYRFNGESGTFLELGPQYTFTKSVNETNILTEGNWQNGKQLSNSEIDVKNNIASKLFAINFGFGAYFIGTDNLSLTTGVRFIYNLGDLRTSEGGLNNASNCYPYNDGVFDNSKILTYSPLKNLSAMFLVELNWDLGYIAKAKCNKRTTFIFF